MAPPPSSLLAPSLLARLVELTGRACLAYRRGDLAARLEGAAQDQRNRQVTVAVAGDYKQGKSSLINALVGYSVCPEDLDRASLVPLRLRYRDHTEAFVAYRDGAGEFAQVPLGFDRLADHVAPRLGQALGDAGSERKLGPVVAAELGVPAAGLKGGLSLVDCPAAGGLGAMGRMQSLTHIAGAAALFYCVDATSELSDIDLNLLQLATRVCPLVVLVLTKIDLVPAWRDVYERNHQRLAEAAASPMPGAADLRGLPQLAVSARLAAHAWSSGDPELARLSGMEELSTFLQHAVLDRAEFLAQHSVWVELAFSVDQLTQQHQAELLALQDGAAAVTRQAELEAAAQRLGLLREAAARWQSVLADGVADLSADIDHDLRDGLRRIGREAEDTLDTEDPLDVWDTFEPWLYGQVAAVVAENFAQLTLRTTALAEQVGALFLAELEAVVPYSLPALDAAAVVATVPVDASVSLRGMSVGQRAFAALRGSYGGVLMASFVSHQSAALMMLGPPAAALMGLLMGNKAVKDESERQLVQRRHMAKLAQRRYTEEVSFVVGKYSRDHLRRVQRALRDHCLAQAETFERTSRASLEQLRGALDADQAQRRARQADVSEELRRIASLAQRIGAAAATAATSVGPIESAELAHVG